MCEKLMINMVGTGYSVFFFMGNLINLRGNKLTSMMS